MISKSYLKLTGGEWHLAQSEASSFIRFFNNAFFVIFFTTIYNKTIIRFGFCDIWNNHNYNKILESDWFLARPIFYQIGARAAKVTNNKVSNYKVSSNKVRVLRMRALFILFLVETKYSLIFLKPSASRMAFLPR